MSQNGKIIGNAEELQYILPGRSFHSTWSSPESLAKYIASHDDSDTWQRGDSAYKDGSEKFHATKNMYEALDLARSGWKEGAEKIERLRSFIKSRHPTALTRVRYGIAGSTPNVPRAVAGNRFNMRLPVEGKSRKRPVLTLVCNMCANWSIDATQISNRAAAVAAMIDEIEAQGFSCEVVSTALTRGNVWSGRKEFTAATSVIVKPSHQPVDTMRLAFGTGHAAMFRRLIFADWQLEPSCQEGLGEGLGSASGSYSKEDLEEMAERNIYFVPSCEGHADIFKDDDSTADKGLDFVIDALRQQGCPAFPKMTEDELSKATSLAAGAEDEDDDDD